MVATQISSGQVCMTGSIQFDKRTGRYYVAWYHAPAKKTKKIWFYKGQPMFRAIDEKGKDRGRELADKLLSLMQGDTENGTFRLEKYTEGMTDVIPYLESWLLAIEGTVSEGTLNIYRSHIRKHFTPFFKAKLVQLHEIQYDTLMELMNAIQGKGVSKLNVMNTLHACLRYAKRSNRIPTMPEFPERGKYLIIDPSIQWLPEDRQDKVIRTIPLEHQPIFWFLKYHLRRPNEACALHKEDYEAGIFIIRRGVSNKKEHDRTKDKKEHIIPAVSDFLPWIKEEEDKQKRLGIVSPYLFINRRGLKKGKPYTVETLEGIWSRACDKAGEDINLYPGTKHSRACHLLNECGLSKYDLKEAGDWASMTSVNRYAETTIATRKVLLEGKVIPLKNKVRNEVRKVSGTNPEGDNP